MLPPHLKRAFLSRGAAALLVATVLAAACSSGAKPARSDRTDRSELPGTGTLGTGKLGTGKLGIASLGEPVRVARAWTTALAPNKRGGWNFITQTYENNSGTPTEYVVLDLETGKQTVTEGPPTIYANSNYQVSEQLRAENGRIFFPQINNQMAYYDPVDETVKQLGKLFDGDDTLIYRVVFGPDGKLYGGTQSNGLPTVFRLDPDTLKTTVIGQVGDARASYSYAYYLAADPPWLYVAVGQSPWELVAIHIKTGRQKVLTTRLDGGFMQLDCRAEGITATLISKSRTPDQQTEVVWVADGKLYPRKDGRPPFRPRDVQPRGNPLQRAPQLDLAAVDPDANGIGRVQWRSPGASSWRETTYKVKYTSPVDIESLIPLPDGTLLGNAKQYHGYFRYNPKDRSTKRYGSFGLSGGPRSSLNGLMYFSGYPNGALYAYDPAKPWTAKRDQDPTQTGTNPHHLGNFVQTGTHYAYFLVPSVRTGRLYYAGRRERDGVGGGIGYYEPSTKTFAGHHNHLSSLDPQGLAVLDGIGRVVYSGRRSPDASDAGEAQLVVYGLDLTELERLTVRPGWQSTGLLYNAPDNGVVIGINTQERMIYRYDIGARKLLDWRDLGGVVGPSVQRESDRSVWIAIDDQLVRFDATSLAARWAGHLGDVPTSSDLLTWQNDRLYWATRSELREISVPASH